MRPLLTDPIARCSATTWRASSLIGVLPTSRAEYRRRARSLSSNGHVVTRHGCSPTVSWAASPALRPAPFPRLAGGEPGGEKALLAGVVDEAERGAVLGGRLRPAAEPPEEVGARGGQQMIPAERRRLDRVDGGQAGGRTLRQPDRHRPVELHHRRRGDVDERLVEGHDPRPVRRLPGARPRVARGDRGLELVGPHALHRPSAVEAGPAARDSRPIPAGSILILEEDPD